MPPPDGVLYAVRTGLYASLTNRCHTAPIIATRGPGFAFGANFPYLEPGYEPSPAEVCAAVEAAGSTGAFPAWDGATVTFAGAGEPLLRPDAFSQASRQLHHNGYDLRVVTNGLFPPSMVEQVLVGRMSKATVGVNAHDEETYQRVMAPDTSAVARCFRTQGGLAGGYLAAVHEFVLTCRAAEILVEVTCVERDIVDVEAVRAFAAGCGASFRTRPYFP
eukprot:jgi/Tetstr1/446694/TSEL_003633.t1